MLLLFLVRASLGTASHTGPKNSGREPGTDINAGLELLPWTLARALVFKPPPWAAHNIILAAPEAPGLLKLVLLHLLHLDRLDPPVGVALLGLESASIVLFPLSTTVVFPVRSSVIHVVPGSIASVPISSSPGAPPVVAPVGCRSPVPSSPPGSSSLDSSVPRASVWPWAGVASVLSLPGISRAGGVGLPGPVLSAGGPSTQTKWRT